MYNDAVGNVFPKDAIFLKLLEVMVHRETPQQACCTCSGMAKMLSGKHACASSSWRPLAHFEDTDEQCRSVVDDFHLDARYEC